MRLRKNYAWMFALVFTLLTYGCGGSDSVGSENMISGSSSKTWKADKELNAAGDTDKLSEAEQQETMQFYADGRFALGGSGTLQTGTWSFDQTAKRLTLQFENQEMTENFEVMKLTDNEMELKGADGSVMQLEAE